MKHLKTAAAHIFFSAIIFIAFVRVSAQDVKPLIESERKFCKTLTEVGLSKSFAMFLDDSSIIFRPGPINGKEFHLKHQNEFKSLFWEPEIAEMSIGNNFGYTTGPWKAPGEIKGSDTSWSYGHYITVWHLSGGNWKALFDGGINYKKKYSDKDSSDADRYQKRRSDIRKPKAKEEDSARVVSMIEKLEREYSDIASNKGEKEALNKFASGEIRLNRAGEFPMRGKDKSVRYLNKDNGRKEFNVMGIKSAPKGDFAFSYGTGEAKDKGKKFSFMRIWKVEGTKWRIIIDLLL